MMWRSLQHLLLLSSSSTLLLLHVLLTPQSVDAQGAALPSAIDDGQIVRFNFRFGFFDDELTPQTEVIKEDVEGVICQTQYFLSALVQNATGDKSVHAKATEIDWGYYEGQDLPAHLNFTIEFTDLDDVPNNWLNDQIMIDQMEALGQPGLQRFITEWVWKAEPAGQNFFLNANKMAFDGVQRAPIEGTLDEAECPATEAPTKAPTSSPRPTTIDGSVYEAPTMTPVEPAAGGAGGRPGSDGSPAAGAGNGTDPDAAGSDLGAADTGAIAAASPGSARPDWPFGENYAGPEDLKPMVDFQVKFNMMESHEKPPTKEEVNALMCEFNEFFTMELRRKLLDGTIHSKAVFIDFYFDEAGAGDKEDIIVNFTSFSYYGDANHTQIAADDVFSAMELTEAEVKNLVEKFIWLSEPEGQNLFAHTERVALDAHKGEPLNSVSMMVEAFGCVVPPPTPNQAGAGGSPNGAGADGGSGNPNGEDGAGGPNGGGTALPANGGDPNLGLGGDAKGSQVRVAFRVSNLDGIVDPTAVKSEGLYASFPVFANEIVNEIAKKDAATRRLRVGGRNLRVVAVPGTATVDDIVEYPCPSNALPELTCHSASAKYDVLMSSDEDQNQVQNQYTDASQTAVDDGTYNNVLQRVDPTTPLYIGIMTSKDQIPPGSNNQLDNDEGWFKWWYILILLLLLLLCCLCCLYCWMLPKNRDDEPKTTVVEEREILVEEFDDEGPDHDGPPEGEEEFVDDPNAVPQGQEPGAGAEDGAMVPYDPNAKAADDAAQRNAILSGSQRGEVDENRKDR